jgi:predicted nuclease of predicted toxin-antitoxin system
LREAGLDVQSVSEQGKFGLPDTQVLQQATETGRVVLTHDSDFGGLALMGVQFIGIIYIRPGHIRPDFTIKTLGAIRENALEVTPPFILVAERIGDTVKIRVRQL